MDLIVEISLGLINSAAEGLPTVFALYKDARVALAMTGVMFIAGALVFLYVWLAKVAPALSQLRRLTREVRAIPNQLEFAGEFRYIEDQFERVAFLRPGWNEFRKYLLFPQRGSKNPIRTAASPGNYINMGTAESGGLNMSFFKEVPDYFVGVGLVLTFLGLVASLYFASVGMQSGDSETARAELVNLLNAATFKFMTSIAGVGISVILSFAFAKFSHGVQHELANLAAALENQVEVATTESVAFGQLGEQRKQTKALEMLLRAMSRLAQRMDKMEHGK